MRYDYKCPKCGYIVEIKHSMLESPAIMCEKCGTKMFKLITGGQSIFIKKVGEYTRYHKEGLERHIARREWEKKHPYEPVPKHLL